jgi:hypothetical protein
VINRRKIEEEEEEEGEEEGEDVPVAYILMQCM